MTKLYLNFYGEKVIIESEWSELVVLLRKDFSSFVCSIFSLQTEKKTLLNLKMYRKPPTLINIPSLISSMQTLNSITYEKDQVRYNDYYGKLLSIFNYKTEEAELYGENIDKMHEVSYLLILSRIGKRLDRLGLHKLHAFAISYEGKALVCMMPMKGGKSTLLLELLKHEKVKMISDDIPLINLRGEVLTFPIKIGLEENAQGLIKVDAPEENIYYINREMYGQKTLICLSGISERVEPVGKVFRNVIIAEGFRFNSLKTEIIKSSWAKTYMGLFKHGVIGFGLPMIVEYFWEFGVSDFIVKTRIFFSRFFAFALFSVKSEKITIKLGKNPEEAAMKIIRFLDSEDR